jgi:uncharacterized protein (TIGR02118 family)
MFKRMSILVRRPADDRAAFARRWEAHGSLVSRLPNIRAYTQNHVEEEFARGDRAPHVRADGIVELQFDTPAAMQEAFSSEAAKPVREDEPSFLGHGTGYVLGSVSSHQVAEDGAKLILAVRSPDHTRDVDTILDALTSQPGCADVICDRVVSIIPRLEMREGPQQVDAFIHTSFVDVDAARCAAHELLDLPLTIADDPDAAVSIFRVRTITFI